MHRHKMHCTPLKISLTFLLSGCLNNPTIEEDIAERCGITVSEYQSADEKLEASRDGASLLAGHCRLTRTSKDTIEGTVIENATQ
jgi:hypothetical protein